MAVSSNIAKQVTTALMKNGAVKRGYLGVRRRRPGPGGGGDGCT